MLILAIIIIFLISVSLAVISLRNLQKGLKTHETKKELAKGRVVFHSSDISSS
jgi:hypothetical protein